MSFPENSDFAFWGLPVFPDFSDSDTGSVSDLNDLNPSLYSDLTDSSNECDSYSYDLCCDIFSNHAACYFEPIKLEEGKVSTDTDIVKSSVSEKTDLVIKEILPRPSTFGVIGTEQKYKPLLNLFLGLTKVDLQNGLQQFNALAKENLDEVLLLLCKTWGNLPQHAKLALLGVLAGIETMHIYIDRFSHPFDTTPDSKKALFGERQLELMLRKLFKNSQLKCDLRTIFLFFSRSAPPITSPFMVQFLNALPTYPLDVQNEVWRAQFFLNCTAIEKTRHFTPLFNAYLKAITQFIEQSLLSNQVIRKTAQAIYQSHSLNWKKQISETLITRCDLTFEHLESIDSIFYVDLIDRRVMSSFLNRMHYLLKANLVHERAFNLALTFEMGMLYSDRRELDKTIRNSLSPLIPLQNGYIGIFIKAITQGNLTETGLALLQKGNLNQPSEEVLFELYFSREQASQLCAIPHYALDRVNIPSHSLRALAHSHFRRLTTIRDLPKFAEIPFSHRTDLCQAFIIVMGYLEFSMEEIQKHLIEKNFPQGTMVEFYQSAPRGAEKLLVPYCTALLLNKKNEDCNSFIKRVTRNVTMRPETAVELEMLQLHAIVAQGPCEKTAELYDKALLFIQEHGNHIYSTHFSNLLSVAKKVGKTETTIKMIQAKMGGDALSLEAVSWMGYQDQIPRDYTGMEYLHQMSILSHVPYNLPFILMKFSLQLHLKCFDELLIACQFYSELLPECGFDYFHARALLDPTYTNQSEARPERINVLLNWAFQRSPRWIDISIASWLLHCQNPRYGISKEEFCSRISFYNGSRISEVLHLLKHPFEKPKSFAERLERLVKTDKIPLYEILTCFSKAGKHC